MSQSDLLKALITIKDVPTGFHVNKRYKNETQLTSSGSVLLPCGFNIYKAIPARYAVAINFAKGGLDYELITSSLRTYIPGEAAHLLRAYAGHRCASWTQRNRDGTRTKYTVSELSFPELGDESLAYTYQTSYSDGSTDEQNRVIIRMGDVVCVVSIVANLNPDPEALETVARKAVARVAQYTGWVDSEVEG